VSRGPHLKFNKFKTWFTCQTSLLPLFSTYQFNQKILVLKYPTLLTQEFFLILLSLPFCVPLVGDCGTNGTQKGASLFLLFLE